MTLFSIPLLSLAQTQKNAAVGVDTVASNGFRFFQFSYSYLHKDSLNKHIKVVHVQSDKLIASYQVKLDSISINDIEYYHAIDSFVHDSDTHAEMLSRSSEEGDMGLSYQLVNSSSLFVFSPVLTSSIGGIADQSVLLKDQYGKSETDSLTSQLNIGGRFISTALLADGTLTGQTVPRNYVRNELYLDIDLFDVPFKFNGYYSTEGNGILRDMNTFGLSFDYHKFYQARKQHLTKKVQRKYDRLKLEQNDLDKVDVGSVRKEIEDLKAQLSSKEYQKEFQKDSLVVFSNDSSIQAFRGSGYERSLRRIQKHREIKERLNFLEKTEQRYTQIDQVLKTDKELLSQSLDKPGNLRKVGKKFGVIRRGEGFLLSLQKFDLGYFNPVYNELILSGVGINGLNIEVTPGLLSASLTGGVVRTNQFSGRFSFNGIPERRIISSRLGIGNKRKFMMAFSFLNGSDNDSSRFAEGGGPQRNYVVGSDISYTVSDHLFIKAEYAKSSSNFQQQQEAGIREVFVLSNGQLSSAYRIRALANLNDQRTRIAASFSSVDPYYYSYGVPFLRTDNQRIELSIEQAFLNRLLTLSILYRGDQDNLHRLKAGTSTSSSLIYTASLRPKKLPYFIITYSPTRQVLYNSASERKVHTHTGFITTTAGYTHSGTDIIYSTSITYSKFWSVFPLTSETLRYTAFDQYSLNQSIISRKYQITMLFGGALLLPLTKDGNIRYTESYHISATKTIKSIEAMVGLRLNKDGNIEQRLIGEGGLLFKLPFDMTLRLLYQHQYSIQTFQSNLLSNMFKIQFVKLF